MSQIQDNESSACADGQELQLSEVPKNITEQFNKEDLNTYKNVLEKLEIKPKTQAENLTEASSVKEKFIQDSGLDREIKFDHNNGFENSQKKIQVESIVAQDFAKVENLMRLGLINSLQGQNLKQQVLKKAFDNVVQNEFSQPNSPPVSQNEGFDKTVVFSEFQKENPNFFNPDGRREVLDYLKSDSVIIGKDELKKISSMVENLEKTAIERYLQNEAYQENLTNSNEVAKRKLTANAQNTSFQDKNISRAFTREQIGKMSGAEFVKYEPLIMEHLKKGLIR